MLGKLVSKLKVGFDSAVQFSEAHVAGFLFKRYPDLRDVLDVMGQIKERVRDDADGSGDHADRKWRPMLLTAGLLCKLQKLEDHSEGHMMEHNITIIKSGDEERMLKVFGGYWHLMTRIGKSLRGFDDTVDKEENDGIEEYDTDNLAQHLADNSGLPLTDILLAHSTDSKHLVGGHCPDFAVILIHHHQQVVINICGTRMIPSPKMTDVFMDLAADSIPFLHGKAHKGMAIGAQNIMIKCKDLVCRALRDNPGYDLMVTGYSLGAGICQLLAMQFIELQREGDLEISTDVVIRSISFGAPLVFESEENNSVGNLFSVFNSSDGLAFASLHTVTKFFEQIKAIEDLNLGRREMFKMLMQKIPTRSEKPIHDSDDDDDDDSDSIVEFDDLSEKWKLLKEAVHSVESEDRLGMAKLGHPASKVYNFKKSSKEQTVIARLFTDTSGFSNRLKLKSSMFNNHMPWGYDGVFADQSTNLKDVSKEDFDTVLQV